MITKRNSLISCLLSLLLILPACAAAGETPAVTTGGGAAISGVNTTVANPILEMDDIEELEEHLGFAVPLPDMPEGYYPVYYAAVGGAIGEIRLTDGEITAVLRKAKGTGDISGIYEEFAERETAEVAGVPTSLRYTQQGGGVALWEYEGYTCSVNVDKGATAKLLFTLAEAWIPRY
jgi:hypothetical protein